MMNILLCMLLFLYSMMCGVVIHCVRNIVYSAYCAKGMALPELTSFLCSDLFGHEAVVKHFTFAEIMLLPVLTAAVFLLMSRANEIGNGKIVRRNILYVTFIFENVLAVSLLAILILPFSCSGTVETLIPREGSSLLAEAIHWVVVVLLVAGGGMLAFVWLKTYFEHFKQNGGRTD